MFVQTVRLGKPRVTKRNSLWIRVAPGLRDRLVTPASGGIIGNRPWATGRVEPAREVKPEMDGRPDEYEKQAGVHEQR
jgi:hypothetical protein